MAALFCLRLDLTAAFDTIDHILLLSRLSSHCGIAGKLLPWMTSYLENRTQPVKIANSTSDPTELEYESPLSISTAWGRWLLAFGVGIQQFSNVTTVNLELSFPTDCPDQLDALRILSLCTCDLVDWFTFNWVLLNSTKNDCLYFVPTELADKLHLFPLSVGKEIIHPSTSAKGVVLSSNLSMDRQISAVASAVNFNPIAWGRLEAT